MFTKTIAGKIKELKQNYTNLMQHNIKPILKNLNTGINVNKLPFLLVFKKQKQSNHTNTSNTLILSFKN